MDVPPPPADTELRNIIDKLAQFVARNGPEFEQMTKNKQKGNPKFQFLFGGEYYQYYQYKVASEQATFKQDLVLGETPNWNSGPPPSITNPEIEAINQQQKGLRDQIKQSEQNLSAQHTVLLQQQQAQIEITVTKAENDELQTEADKCDIFLEDLYNILQPIIDNCTKDSISNGKAWILQRATNRDRAKCIFHCLLMKVVQGASFPQKLHVIYLVNDIMHHIARKRSTDLKDALEDTLIPMFCNANLGASEDQKVKLDKLLKLWDAKLNILRPEQIEQMRHPADTYQKYQAQKVEKHSEEIAALTRQTKTTFERYQGQHQAYVCHAMQQVMELEHQKQALIEQQQALIEQQQSIPPPQLSQVPLPPSSNLISLDSLQNIPPPNGNNEYQTNTAFPPPGLMQMESQNGNAPNQNMDPLQFSQPPPGFFPPPGLFPDFSKPPPGFPPAKEPFMEDLLPTNPYYDLPAGLICALIKLEDFEYKPLDPAEIRLPPPAPPSERLLAALEAFYSLPTHERPRDSEGWEKLGLYEYYKAKNTARKLKEEQIASGLRQKSRSPSPVVIPTVKEPSPPKRRYRSKSPTPPPVVHRSSRRTHSRSKSRSRSRSRSPKRRRHRERGRRSSRRSPSRSPSRSPVNRRTPSPHSRNFDSSFSSRQIVQELDSSNKGHQMLKKMGWGGSGLGANEQGIDAPISGGDVRDRQDQFKGVGCNLNDPYENFRKNKGAAFITRMKARAEERATESKVTDY